MDKIILKYHGRLGKTVDD